MQVECKWRMWMVILTPKTALSFSVRDYLIWLILATQQKKPTLRASHMRSSVYQLSTALYKIGWTLTFIQLIGITTLESGLITQHNNR